MHGSTAGVGMHSGMPSSLKIFFNYLQISRIFGIIYSTPQFLLWSRPSCSFYFRTASVFDSLIMATDKEILDGEGLRDMTIEDLQEFSNIFASEFNSSDIHDRVLCFQIIENEELNTEVDNENVNSETRSDYLPICGVDIGERTSNDGNVCKL